MIKKAVLPIAGLGTRFLPLSKELPKEFWPLADLPVIQYIVEEARDSGIEEIIFVISPEKKMIVDYFNGSAKAEKILKELDFSSEEIEAIKHCIISHRFRNNQEPKTKEAQILFDADKIDSVGAIGIARSFIWVGKNNAKMYTDIDIEKYINDNLGGDPNSRIRNKTKHSPQIEFETKFKNLANSLYTEKGRKLCQERIDFYKNFLNQLEKEILE